MKRVVLLLCLAAFTLGQQPDRGAVTATDIEAPDGSASSTSRPAAASSAAPPASLREESSKEPTDETPEPPLPAPRGEPRPTAGKRVAAFWVILPEK